MKTSAVVLLFVVSACGIDDRHVELNAYCVAPPPDGTIADFSEATTGGCPAGYCAAELVGQQAVSLGEGTYAGLVYPYAPIDLRFIDLGTPAPPETAPVPALWAALDSGPAPSGSSEPDGMALRFVDCVERLRLQLAQLHYAGARR